MIGLIGRARDSGFHDVFPERLGVDEEILSYPGKRRSDGDGHVDLFCHREEPHRHQVDVVVAALGIRLVDADLGGRTSEGDRTRIMAEPTRVPVRLKRENPRARPKLGRTL
jgi:hypothetical protein